MAVGFPVASSLPAPRDGRRVVLTGVGAAGLACMAVATAAGLERLRRRPAEGTPRRMADAEAAMRELHASRARIAAGAERERRRIERDLHDGAQQRLVALRIELELTGELVRRDPERGASRLHELEHEVDEALEELRALAHGVYPPLLADRGLAEALRAVTDRFAVHAQLVARAVGRYSPEVESAVYFCVLEALQNVLKHARGARLVEVRLDGAAPGLLRLCVRDDGAGADGGVLRPGVGVTNMRDRLATLGGELQLSSTPGVGTLVSGWLPTGAGAVNHAC